MATFYHELQEARTDPDVEGMLTKVFKEVPLADGSGTVPVQLQYSNAVHGPEGTDIDTACKYTYHEPCSRD